MTIKQVLHALETRRVAIILFVLSFITFVLTLRIEINPWNSYDEGLILVGATRFIAGELPHRDFYANYGPGQFALTGAIFRLLGTNVLAERIGDILVKSLIVVFVYCLCRKAASVRAGIAAGLVSLLWLCDVGAHGYPVWASLLLVLMSVYLLADKGRVGQTFAAGIVAGLVVYFRYDIGIAATGAISFIVLCRAVTDRSKDGGFFRAVLSSFGVYLAGASLAVAPLLIFYLEKGVFPDLFYQVVLFQFKYYAENRQLSWPDISYPPSEFMVYAPPVIVFMYVATLIACWRRNIIFLEGKYWIGAFLGILALMLFFKGTVRVGRVHMASSFIVSFALLTIILDKFTIRFEKLTGYSRMLYISALLAILITVVSSASSLMVTSVHIPDSVAGLVMNKSAASTTYPSIDRLGPFTLPKDQAMAINYILNNTDENEPIFVGTLRHDKIVVNDVLFYFLSKRTPATKWYHFDPGLQTGSFIQSKIINELKSKRIRYVVLTSRFDDLNEANASAISSGIRILDQYIQKNYKEVRSYGTYHIMQSVG